MKFLIYCILANVDIYFCSGYLQIFILSYCKPNL